MDSASNGNLNRQVCSDSPTQIALRHLVQNRIAQVSGAVILLFALIALFAPAIAPHDPLRTAPIDSLLPPSSTHPMGTDLIGRDVLSRVIFGGRISLTVGFVSVGISASLGVLLGLVAGYYGGSLDNLIMRFVDILMAFPGLLLAMAIVALLGTGMGNVMIAVGIGGIPSFSRLVRGCVLSLREELYVEAARSVGASNGRILVRHVLPNAFPPLLVLISMSYGWSLLSASGLSFLGLGAQPPDPEWGAMLSDGRSLLWVAPWTAIFPGIAIMLVVLAANLLGDAIRDALDPRLRL